MCLSRTTRLIALCAVLSAPGCTGTDDTNDPVVGAIEVTVRTEGSAPDPDGYSLSVDGGAGRSASTTNSDSMVSLLAAALMLLDNQGTPGRSRGERSASVPCTTPNRSTPSHASGQPNLVPV